MNCQQVSGCGLSLPRGAAHLNLESCVEAMKDALEKATTCRACGTEVVTVLHAGCVPAELVNRGAKLGTGVLERRITEWLAERLSGDPGPRASADPDDQPRRWKP